MSSEDSVSLSENESLSSSEDDADFGRSTRGCRTFFAFLIVDFDRFLPFIVISSASVVSSAFDEIASNSNCFACL